MFKYVDVLDNKSLFKVIFYLDKLGVNNLFFGFKGFWGVI